MRCLISALPDPGICCSRFTAYLAGTQTTTSYPIIRFPMTKYLFLILTFISPNEAPSEGVKRELVDYSLGLLAPDPQMPNDLELESAGLIVDFP